MSDIIDIELLNKVKEQIVSGIKFHEEKSKSLGGHIPRVWRNSSRTTIMRENHKKQADILRSMLEPLQQLIVLNKEAVKNFKNNF